MDSARFGRVLVAIDASRAARAAVSLALSIVAPDGEVVFAHAINRALVVAECVSPYGGDATFALTTFEQDEQDLFAAALSQAKTNGIRASVRSLDGNAGYRLAELMENDRFDAVVVGTRANHGIARLLLGSTAETVLRSSGVPVFVTSEQNVSRVAGGISKVVLALDGSEPGIAAGRSAVALAGGTAELTVVHVVEDTSARESAFRMGLLAIEEAAQRNGTRITVLTLTGDTDSAISIAAQAQNADLIVIGTHGRTGLERMRLGSVAESVVRSSPLPVMVVPAPRMHARAEPALTAR